MNRLTASISLIALMFALTACGSKRVHRFFIDLPPETLIAVDVENFAGEVEVNGDYWSRDQAMIVIHRHIGNADRDLQLALDQGMEFSAEVVQTEAGSIVKVRSDSAFPERTEHKADVVVRVPRLDGVRITNNRGRVEASHFRGAVQILNNRGPIEARTDHPLRQPSELITTDGSIFVQLPRASHVDVDAQTLNGTIQVLGENYTDTHAIADVRAAGNKQLSMALNEAEAPLTIRTSKGRIYIELDTEDAGFPERWWRSEGINEKIPTEPGGTKRYQSNLDPGTQRDPKEAPGSGLIPGM